MQGAEKQILKWEPNLINTIRQSKPDGSSFLGAAFNVPQIHYAKFNLCNNRLSQEFTPFSGWHEDQTST